MLAENIQAHMLYGATKTSKITIVSRDAMTLIIDSPETMIMMLNTIIKSCIDIAIPPTSYRVAKFVNNDKEHIILLFYNGDDCISKFKHISLPIESSKINMFKYMSQEDITYMCTKINKISKTLKYDLGRLMHEIYVYKMKNDITILNKNILKALFLVSLSKKSISAENIKQYVSDYDDMMRGEYLLNVNPISTPQAVRYDNLPKIMLVDMDILLKLINVTYMSK